MASTSQAAPPARPTRPAPNAAALGSGLGLVLGLVLALLLFAPARWLADAVHHASQGRMQWPQARGTVWTGQSQLVLSGGADSQDRTALPQGLHWTMRPAWQQGPVLALALHAPCCTPEPVQLRLRPGWTTLGLEVDALQSQWPAALLGGLGTPWNTLQLQATLALSSPGFTVQLGPRQLQTRGQINLDIVDASSRLSTVRPMGSYRLRWDAQPGAADAGTLTLGTLQGALQLQGQGQWVAGRLRFQGEAVAAPGREDALANLLNLLGRRQGGRTLIQIG